MKRISKKSPGNIADLMSLGIFLLAMMVMLTAFFNSVKVMRIREDVSQIVRKYTLIAETKGYIDSSSKQSLTSELKKAGISDINLNGTTFGRVGFGNIVSVKVTGKIDGKYTVSESRASTAKY